MGLPPGVPLFKQLFLQVNKIFLKVYSDAPELSPVKMFNCLLKGFLYNTLLKSKMLAEVLTPDQREMAHVCFCLSDQF